MRETEQDEPVQDETVQDETVQDSDQARALVKAWNDYADYVKDWADRKGWWPDGVVRNDAELIMLYVTELAEAVEGLRNGNPASDKIGVLGFSQVEEEIADTIIRTMDHAAHRGWRIAEAIVAKMAYNEHRAQRHGGKAF